jgi:hypothetical protein
MGNDMLGKTEACRDLAVAAVNQWIGRFGARCRRA